MARVISAGKPAEAVALLGAEGDRVIAVVVDPVAGPDLKIVAVARRRAIFHEKVVKLFLKFISHFLTLDAGNTPPGRLPRINARSHSPVN